MRKPFDPATGKHAVKPPSPNVDIFDPPAVDMFSVPCPRCEAPAGKPCIRLEGKRGDAKVYPHPARVEAARSKIDAP